MTTAPVSDYAIKDFRFLATDLGIMHQRLSGDNEVEALGMRQDMAESIMQMYEDNGSSITQEEALALVDEQYKYISGGATIIDTINTTTKSADSFWNYVPIVNLFIDDTTAEDLYKIMEGEEVDTETVEENKFGKTASCVGIGVVAGTAVGAAVGLIFGPGGAIIGAKIGAGIGAAGGGWSGFAD